MPWDPNNLTLQKAWRQRLHQLAIHYQRQPFFYCFCASARCVLPITRTGFIMFPHSLLEDIGFGDQTAWIWRWTDETCSKLPWKLCGNSWTPRRIAQTRFGGFGCAARCPALHAGGGFQATRRNPRSDRPLSGREGSHEPRGAGAVQEGSAIFCPHWYIRRSALRYSQLLYALDFRQSNHCLCVYNYGPWHL